MQPSAIYTFDVPAYSTYTLRVAGQYFKILSASNPINIRTENQDLKGLVAGQGQEKTPFSYINFTDSSGFTNTIRVVVADQNFVDGLTGSIAISANKLPISAGFANTARTVTNASTQLVAASPARQYFLFQNKDATANAYLVFGAGPATVALGIKVPPGGSYELDGVQSTSAIQVIGDTASNANCITVEG